MCVELKAANATGNSRQLLQIAKSQPTKEYLCMYVRMYLGKSLIHMTIANVCNTILQNKDNKIKNT